MEMSLLGCPSSGGIGQLSCETCNFKLQISDSSGEGDVVPSTAFIVKTPSRIFPCANKSPALARPMDEMSATISRLQEGRATKAGPIKSNSLGGRPIQRKKPWARWSLPSVFFCAAQLGHSGDDFFGGVG